MMQLFLIYECDTLLSKHTRTLVAICDSMESVERCLTLYPYCSIKQMREVRDNKQSQCGNPLFRNNFLVEEATLNETIE